MDTPPRVSEALRLSACPRGAQYTHRLGGKMAGRVSDDLWGGSSKRGNLPRDYEIITGMKINPNVLKAPRASV